MARQTEGENCESIMGITNALKSPVLPASLGGLHLALLVEFDASEAGTAKTLELSLIGPDGELVASPLLGAHPIGFGEPGMPSTGVWDIVIPKDITLDKPGIYLWQVAIDGLTLGVDLPFIVNLTPA